MQSSANQCAYANAASKTIPEQDSVADGTPAADATAARRPQQPTAAVVLSWWTEERIEELKVQWLAGYSAAIIARALETTRNAVLGKVHRLGLSNRTVTKVMKRVCTIPRPFSKPRLKSVFKSPEIKPRLVLPKSSPKLLVVISAITGAPVGCTKRARAPIGEMTKNQLRAMLTEAVINTAALKIA